MDRTLHQLEFIKDDATLLVAAGVPDADAIYQTEPDFEGNRVLITVSRASDVLFNALAGRYGREAIVVRVAPDRPTVKRLGRNDDTPPFWGGAKINAPNGPCTTAFAWREVTGAYEMLTAAHCAYDGGTVYNGNNAYNMGTVTSASEENWSPYSGTVYYTGQSTYRGDVALIRISSSYSIGSAAVMYRGPAGSSDSAPVKEKWYRSPQNGDQFCTGGHSTGEICGWTVDAVGINAQETSTGLWWRNVTRGYGSSGVQSGDSGGPTYTVRGDGGIAAKGTIAAGGSSFTAQYVFFTDIWDSYYALPGDLLIQ